MNPIGVAATLTTGRTLRQGRSMERGKFTREYTDEVSVCEMDSTTLEVLQIEEGTPVLIRSHYGSVVVRSRIDRNAEPGVIFIPCGPYANMVVSSDTDGSGMPAFKGVPVEIFAAPKDSILPIEELFMTENGED